MITIIPTKSGNVIPRAEDDIQNFIQAVRKMREYQKLYFKTRSRDILEKSKNWEKLIDMAILPKQGEPSLFDSKR